MNRRGTKCSGRDWPAFPDSRLPRSSSLSRSPEEAPMPVRVERRDRVLTVIHSRAEARNAVDP
jgi:hypothetical protein